MADVLVPSHSTGYVAFLNLCGSTFLLALLKVLAGEERHLPLKRLLTRITGGVALRRQARGTNEGCKEMPCFVTNLWQEVLPLGQAGRGGGGGQRLRAAGSGGVTRGEEEKTNDEKSKRHPLWEGDWLHLGEA